MPQENNQGFTDADREKLDNITQLLVGGIREGKHFRGLADMVQEHHEVLHGTDKEPGLIQDNKNLQRLALKVSAYATAGSLIVAMLWHLLTDVLFRH